MKRYTPFTLSQFAKAQRQSSMPKPNRKLLAALDDFGRERLSEHFFMRDFLYSEVSAVHGIPNVPDDAELAVSAGKGLCENLLETASKHIRSCRNTLRVPKYRGKRLLQRPRHELLQQRGKLRPATFGIIAMPRTAWAPQIRNHYRPDRIRILFVGESPPASGKFFYNGNSQLARNMRRILGRLLLDDPKDFLARFEASGCCLDDLVLIPVNKSSKIAQEASQTERDSRSGQAYREISTGSGCCLTEIHRA